jgi:hypothetical protein
MLKLASNDVLECARIDDLPVPSTYSFMSQCVQCDAPIWVPCSSPIEPKRVCSHCIVARTDELNAISVVHRKG